MGDEEEGCLSDRKMGSVGMITVLLHFQVKMGTHKRKSIVGSMLCLPAESLCDTHTHTHTHTHTGSSSAVWFPL